MFPKHIISAKNLNYKDEYSFDIYYQREDINEPKEITLTVNQKINNQIIYSFSDGYEDVTIIELLNDDEVPLDNFLEINETSFYQGKNSSKGKKILVCVDILEEFLIYCFLKEK